MDWKKYKSFPNKQVVYCENDVDKNIFFSECRENGIIPNLSPFAVKEWDYYLCVRSNGRLELMAFPANTVITQGYEIINYKPAAAGPSGGERE